MSLKQIVGKESFIIEGFEDGLIFRINEES